MKHCSNCVFYGQDAYSDRFWCHKRKRVYYVNPDFMPCKGGDWVDKDGNRLVVSVQAERVQDANNPE